MKYINMIVAFATIFVAGSAIAQNQYQGTNGQQTQTKINSETTSTSETVSPNIDNGQNRQGLTSNSEEDPALMNQAQNEQETESETRTEYGSTSGEKERLSERERERERLVQQYYYEFGDTIGKVEDKQIQTKLQQELDSYISSSSRANTALSTAEDRSSFAKTLIGPNYKELKKVRDTVSSNSKVLDNMTVMLVDLKDEKLREQIQNQIRNLETYNYQLNSFIEQETEGFSLFGWLNRILAKY